LLPLAAKASISPVTSRYRPDIDGLRAIAVIAVIAFHFFPTLCPGGYVGVDVFFVISGFLITGILQESHGRGRLIDFWGRRIRRIFPSLLAVLLVSAVMAHFLLFHSESQRVSDGILYASFFWTNMFLRDHSGYFDFSNELRVNLHLWSLAIEEQFYLFWPFIIGVVSPRYVRKVVVAGFVVSLGYCIYSSYQSPRTHSI
jgi:peptidoglycan/LPS O-acetylase OafA/YrhL